MQQQTIRAFAPDDLATLQSIREAAFAPVFDSFRSIVGEQIAALAFRTADQEQAKHLDEMCAAESSHRVLVVTCGEQTVGFVSYTLDAEQRTGEIGLNAVSPEYAGRGIGTWMYEHVLAVMKEQGMQLAVVGTGGDDSHAPARRSYAKAGFGPGIPSVYLYKLL